MSTLLDFRIHQAVDHDGLARVAEYDDDSQHVLYVEGDVVRSLLAADWLATRGPLPTDPTPEQVNAAIEAKEQARLAALTDAAALRQRVLQVAQSAVGVRADLLTAAQARALNIVRWWQDGALDAGLVVKPLAEWVRG